MANRRGAVLFVRVSEKDAETIRRAAARAITEGRARNLNDWMKKIALAAAADRSPSKQLCEDPSLRDAAITAALS
jgi:hypothetical protein